MKKNILFFVLIFLAGFFIHAYFFPDLLPTQINLLGRKAVGLPQQEKALPTPEFSFSTAYVDYQDGKFKPNNIVSKTGNHVAITNRDKNELMWLDSDNTLLKTTRGFGFSERLDVVLPKAGTFKIVNKLNSEATLMVTVKP